MRTISPPSPVALDTTIEIVRLLADAPRAKALLGELRAASAEYAAALAAIVGREDKVAQREQSVQAGEASLAAHTGKLSEAQRTLEAAKAELANQRDTYAAELANLESQKQHAAKLLADAAAQANATHELAVRRSGELDAREADIAASQRELEGRLQKLREI